MNGCRSSGWAVAGAAIKARSANKYTKPYIFFFLHFLFGRVKWDLGVHKLVIGDGDGEEQKLETRQTA
jgi:hypothetical protein